MKFCTSYYQQPNVREKVDEIRFSVYVLNSAIEYAEQHPDKRVIVEILDLHDRRTPETSKLYTIISETPNHNIAYDFYSITDLIEYHSKTRIKDNEFMYHHPVVSWAQARELVDWYEVSDLVIGEPLSFACDDLVRFKNSVPAGLCLRVRPFPETNYFEASGGMDNGLNHFWTLPQYLSLYEGIFDVIDILDANVVRESALVNEFTSDNHITAINVDTLLPTIAIDVPITVFDDTFFKNRQKCDQRCMKSPNSCHLCNSIIDTWKTFTQARARVVSAS